MNNVILAVWSKGQNVFLDHPRIIYGFWVTFDHKTLWIHYQREDTEAILLKNIEFVSMVGQFDKTGQEWHHHDDRNKPAVVEV